MLHAKTAVADGRWARVGSTNLNIASWIGNCELDAVVEDDRSRRDGEDVSRDLENATEIVLDAPALAGRRASRVHPRVRRAARGSTNRAAAGAVRIGNAIGAALTNARAGPVESR